MALVRVFLGAVFVLAYGNILSSEATPFNARGGDVCETPVCEEAAQFLLDSMDTTVDPCEDFYRYACGGWIEKHPIPGEKSSYSSFSALDDKVEESVAELVKTVPEGNQPKPVLDAITLFQGCVDEGAREEEGGEPLKYVLDSLGGWPMIKPDWSDEGFRWETQVATMIRSLVASAIITIKVDADLMDSSQNIIYFDQASLDFQRSVLLNYNASERTRAIVAAYKNYMVTAGKLLNPNIDEIQLGRDADEIIQFETALTKLTSPPEQRKDPSAMIHKMTVSEAQRVTENEYFDWTDFLNNVFQDFPQVTDETEVVLMEIDYIKNAIKLAHDTDPRILANFLGWTIVNGYGGETSKNFRDNAFRFIQAITGVEEQQDMETQCIGKTVALFQFAVGRLYVDKYFTEEQKRDVDEMVEEIRAAFRSTIQHNTWMDPETKNKALEKLEAVRTKMGYPPWIRDDEKLNEYYRFVPDLNKDEYFLSFLKVIGAVRKIALEKWNQPTQKATEWFSSPSTVNAFYDPTGNSITFPAGILNAPFYQYGRSLALNYGGIGSVIGHEISHGFDNSGSQFDKEGNLVNWWSDETKEKFEEKANCFRVQYSTYVEPMTQIRLNGNLTIGDDIADNGGFRNAYVAYKMRVLQSDENEPMDKRLPGVPASLDQLFFLGYAMTNCRHDRKEALQMSIPTDVHTVDEFRVIVPLSNSREFSEAYNCPLGSRMNPESKCLLW